MSAIQRLVDDGTITSSEAQAADREIQAGTVDTDTLASGALSAPQLEAVEQALANTKRALAARISADPRTPKEPAPAGTPHLAPRKDRRR